MRRTALYLRALTAGLVAVGVMGFLALFRYLAGPAPQPLPIAAVGQAIFTPTATPAPWQVFFTQPESEASRTLRGGPDAPLAAAIEQATQQVDIAIYDLNLWSIRDAILQAARHGVNVRLVVESTHLDRPELQDLIAAGIPVVGDEREGLMHNKFVVIDGYEVWTGSMNFTVNGAYRNNNNLLRLQSSRLATDFTTEFEEMFIGHHFGPDSVANTPYPHLTLNGTPVEVYFAPDDHPLARLLALVSQAQRQVVFMAFSFTADDLGDALIALHQRGVEVRGVFEARQVTYGRGSEYPRLLASGVAVRLDGNPHNMHHKVMVVDGRWVVTGSYNFTYSAEKRNDETLLIFDSPALAAAYLEEFERVWAAAEK